MSSRPDAHTLEGKTKKTHLEVAVFVDEDVTGFLKHGILARLRHVRGGATHEISVYHTSRVDIFEASLRRK